MDNAEGWRTERAEATGEDATGLHVKNFIDCVRSREKPAADIEIGHRSTIASQLGNISIRTGHKLRWDATKEEIVDDPEAARSFSDNPPSLGTKSYGTKPPSREPQLFNPSPGPTRASAATVLGLMA